MNRTKSIYRCPISLVLLLLLVWSLFLLLSLCTVLMIWYEAKIERNINYNSITVSTLNIILNESKVKLLKEFKEMDIVLQSATWAQNTLFQNSTINPSAKTIRTIVREVTGGKVNLIVNPNPEVKGHSKSPLTGQGHNAGHCLNNVHTQRSHRHPPSSTTAINRSSISNSVFSLSTSLEWRNLVFDVTILMQWFHDTHSRSNHQTPVHVRTLPFTDSWYGCNS